MPLFKKKENGNEEITNKQIKEVQDNLRPKTTVEKGNLDNLFKEKSTQIMTVAHKFEKESKSFKDADNAQDNIKEFEKTQTISLSEINKKPTSDKDNLTAAELFDKTSKEMNTNLPPMPEVPNLTPVDSYEYYDFAKNKLIENFNKIKNINTVLPLTALAIQVQLMLSDEKFIEPAVIEKEISKFIQKIFDAMHSGRSIVLDHTLIFETISYGDKDIPILISNSKLLLQDNMTSWETLVEQRTEKKMLILETFITMLNNALNNGFEVALTDDTIILRTGTNSKNYITSFFANENFLLKFAAKSKLQSHYTKNSEEIHNARMSKEALSRIHHVLKLDAKHIEFNEEKYKRLKQEQLNREKKARLEAERARLKPKAKPKPAPKKVAAKSAKKVVKTKAATRPKPTVKKTVKPKNK